MAWLFLLEPFEDSHRAGLLELMSACAPLDSGVNVLVYKSEERIKLAASLLDKYKISYQLVETTSDGWQVFTFGGKAYHFLLKG